MGKEQPHYISYLLRVWRANGNGEVAWRASLESPHTGERIGFANLNELFIFLQQQTDEGLNWEAGRKENGEEGGAY
jgi:hypothetical protein